MAPIVRSGAQGALSDTVTLDPDDLARAVRKRVLTMTRHDVPSHLVSALSTIEILAAVYGAFVDLEGIQRRSPDRDRVVLSKGHAALALYATLVECGVTSSDSISDYGPGARNATVHPLCGRLAGVEATSGSLGHGVALGAGMALGARLRSFGSRTIVILGDGELQEGSIWEAALLAAHRALSQLFVIVDLNGLQQTGAVQDIAGLEPLADKWKAFGWHVEQVDGHDTSALAGALRRSDPTPKPVVLLARTVKGRGVPSMEGKDGWHFRVPGVLEGSARA
jgi:transketolase